MQLSISLVLSVSAAGFLLLILSSLSVFFLVLSGEVLSSFLVSISIGSGSFERSWMFKIVKDNHKLVNNVQILFHVFVMIIGSVLEGGHCLVRIKKKVCHCLVRI